MDEDEYSIRRVIIRVGVKEGQRKRMKTSKQVNPSYGYLFYLSLTNENIKNFRRKKSDKFNNNIGSVYNLDDNDDMVMMTSFILNKDNNVNMNQKY
ncbi:hypothetical protein M0813_04633 [Anaeramoeba flamelloides]|uniref:C2 domain-containing protein n=1 Tax=Anaeramoeba flamelloides TaxID=1746091 RepID=A0ABQ8XJL5_9EUKA|nr:hypothetical protein M0813_04633 [Anaeramoeba flamelloides]